MKVIVLGAAGRLGRRVLAEAVHAGHQTTAYVRSRSRLQDTIGAELLSRVSVVEGDVLNRAALAAAMSGQEAAVQAAGYLGDTPEEGQRLQQLVQAATQAAAECLVGPRRLWVLGGAGALDLPGRPGTMLLQLPGFPPKYQTHQANYRFLCRPEFRSLDWSFACPGVMFEAQQTAATRAAAGREPSAAKATAEVEPAPAAVQPARVVADVLPVVFPGWAALLPTALLLPAVAAVKGQLASASYEQVAAAIVANLQPGGLLRHRRVGFSSVA